MSHNQNQVQNKTMCNAGAQTSPPPPSSYVNTPPKPQNGMSKTPDAGQSSSKWTDRMKGLRATPSEQKLAAHGAAGTDGSVPGSAGSSITAVDAAHGQNHNQSSAGHAHMLTNSPLTSSPQSSGTDLSSGTVTASNGRKKQDNNSSSSNVDNDHKTKTRYEEWYPGDASHDGRPAWWNRLFCCGYGIGCLLCPCSGWTCKHERG